MEIFAMATAEKEPEVMTPEELASFLRVPEATVRQYAVRFYIPGRQIGEEWRFWRVAIQEWLRGRSGKEVLLSQAGAFEDDAGGLAELRAAIYRDRGRSEIEEGE
ncbi:MAG: helix-turn-helix domain-containing protein [Planctomycetota bacterium]|nr:helix-turn-helix domain-containing protein [Planctomycetota bacterium]